MKAGKYEKISDVVHAAHDAMRGAMRRLSPAMRSDISTIGGMQQTHFYAWLRGDDQAISLDRLDAVLRDMGFCIFAMRTKMLCRPIVDDARGGKIGRVAWAAVDWSLGGREIAKKYMVTENLVSTNRRKFAPRTLRSQRTYARLWTEGSRALLGTMPDSKLARKIGCSRANVSYQRAKLKIPHYSRKNPAGPTMPELT